MFRVFVAAAILAGVPVLARAQSASSPLIISATVISTCSVDVPRWAEASTFATMPIGMTCARGATTPRVERPIGPRRIEIRDALLIIDF
jgi:hypothetical protein